MTSEKQQSQSEGLWQARENGKREASDDKHLRRDEHKIVLGFRTY